VTALNSPNPKVNHVRRVVALLGLISLLLGLAACGNQKDDSASDGNGGIDAVTVSGDFGKPPEVKWNSAVDVNELASKTLIEGKGDQVAKGDQALIHVWIGNGFSKAEVYSSYAKGSQEAVTVDDSKLLKAIYAAVVDHTVGSRVEVVAPPADAFGDQGNPSLNIGNEDDVVFVVDIMNKVLTKPEGTAQKPPAGTPKLVEKDGVPTGFDFSTSPKTPSDKLQVFTLIKGTGPKLAAGDNTLMNYLGEVYGSKDVFDQSYDAQPFPTVIGAGQVIKGWDQGLVGVPVGSRVLLVIPPGLAYGEAGQGAIKGNSTLVFVVDVLAAY
jgi:peptidylprolyl isomerase